MDFVFENLGPEHVKYHINAKNLEGWNPAHFAGFLNNFDSLNYLIEKGAKITDEND